MENPISKAYETIDSIVMKGTNKAVKAYNWTTGGTKLELANNLMNLSAVGIAASNFAMLHPYLSVPFSVGYLLAINSLQNSFKFSDERERKALDRGMKDIYVEELKNIFYPFGAYITLVSSISYTVSIISSDHSPQKEFGGIALTAGTGCFSAAFQVMRADYFPPRKNCIARGLEKIAELYNASMAKPAETAG